MTSCSARLVGLSLRFGAAAAIAVVCAALLDAQVPGRNVNMVSGRDPVTGDPYLQRQNEPSIAASTRNPLHLLGGANDYRTVDLPGFSDSIETGDAWMGVFKSYDGGNSWRSTLIPGYPQDPGNLLPNPSPLSAYKAAADPVVRAGTNGLFYYSGIVFDREKVVNGAVVKGKSAMFVSRFIDNNNQEAGDPIVFLGTTLVATSPEGGPFIDKPWYAVDRPRTGAQMCTIPATTQKSPTPADPDRTFETPAQTFLGGAAYAVYSMISGEGAATRSQIFFKRSLDCGVTWSAPVQISSIVDPINQGATLAIDPNTGGVYIAWRRFTADGTDDSIMVTRSLDQGRKWDPPGRARRFPRGKKLGLVPEIHGQKFKQATELAPLASLDQPTESYQFRTNAYPTMTIDGAGRVYVAWAERGFAPLNQDADDGDARVLIATSMNGASWSEPTLVANDAFVGHQVMPTLTFAGGKLMIAYYDFREDISGIFMQFIDERWAVVKRHTVDVRAAMASPGPSPTFLPSVRVSEYLMGSRPGTGPRPVEQLQFNPPNLKLFKSGSVPFFGDYIDLTPSPAFVPAPGGGWVNNTAPSSAPLFHVVWTENRDVIPPANGDWTMYTPPGGPTNRPSTYDPTQTVAGCTPGHEGMRNQNIYTARITGGLVAGSPGNTKPLSTTLPRSFVVFAQNATEQTRTYRLTILNQPVGGRASFLQDSVFPATPTFTPPAVVTTLDVQVPRRSTIARSVFATSSDPDAQISVSVKEIVGVGGAESPDGAQTTVILNPDISNPDISNPDISNPDISNPDISNAEVSNPDISNPDISNPDISNPDISNPDISNPDISNVQVANPDISNPDISNPDISNPDISNPDISNPDISNPDISNGSLTDTSWTLTNDGNTAASYSVKLLLTGSAPNPSQNIVQLVLHKVYQTPVGLNCALGLHTQNVLLANITHPVFLASSAPPTDPDITNPNGSNATLWLAPGETARITIRVLDLSPNDSFTFDAASQVKPAAVAVAKDVTLTGGVLTIGNTVPVALPPGVNALFVNVPAAITAVSQPVGSVGVRVFGSNAAPIAGASVIASLHTSPGNVQVGGNHLATTAADGVATFNIPTTLTAGLYQLRAQVTAQLAPTPAPASLATVYSHEIVSVPPAAPGVVGQLTYNGVAAAGAWTQNVSQDFELEIDLDAKKTSLRINGALVNGLQDVNFAEAATNLTSVSMEVGAPGAAQVVAWDGVQVRNASGNVVLLNGNFDGDTVGTPPATNPPGPPVGDRFILSATNASVLVRLASGNMVSQPVELAQLPGTSSASLTGVVVGGTAPLPGEPVPAPPPTTGVWIVSWKSLIKSPGAQVSARVVVRDSSSRVLASVNYAPAPATTFLVTNTNNSGPGSFNQAILSSNATPGTDVIRFNLGAGPVTINLTSRLPTITDAVVIDATANGCTGGAPVVEVFGGSSLVPAGAGLLVTAGNTTIRGLSITGFKGNGIEVRAGGSNRVECSRIGIAPDVANTVRANTANGIQIIDSANNLIGGSNPALANVVSGNAGEGIRVDGSLATANIIQGNFIGTDNQGVLDKGNGASGVYLRHAPGNSVLGNTVSGNNGFAGIAVCGNLAFCGGIPNVAQQPSTASGNVILGNYVGTSSQGLTLGNTGRGVSIDSAPNTQVGPFHVNGQLNGAPNVIAFNAVGIVVFGTGATGNKISVNSIHSNTGLGIDLGTAGVTPNDPGDGDAGPNQLQNFPLLLTAQNQTNGTSLFQGELQSTPNTSFVFHLFYGPTCDTSGNGEGQTWLTTVSGLPPSGPNGELQFSVGHATHLPAGSWVTATATDPAGNTSEFSVCKLVSDPPVSGPVQWTVGSGGNGNYYEYVKTPGLSWTEASAAAVARTHNGIQGRLVSITSAAENAFVESLRNGGQLRAWIGLRDAETAGPLNFVWMSGEPVVGWVPGTAQGLPWATGEPNNPDSEFWVEMFAGGVWNNNQNIDPNPDFRTLGYLVEYPLPPGGPLTFASFNPATESWTSTSIGTWSPGIAQTFELTVNMGTKTASLRIDGQTVAPNLAFTATSLSSLGVELGTTGTQRLGWDDIAVTEVSGDVTAFSADFTNDVVNQSPGTPAIGTWQITNTNGSVLVRTAAGTLTSKPVEIHQFGGVNSVRLTGNLATPLSAGVWRITWKSVMMEPPAQLNFVPVVLRGIGGILAIEYR